MASNNNTYAGIKAQQNNELKEINNTYNPMISNSDKFYNQQINAAKDYQKTQTDIQNQQTDQIVKEINQNKEYQRQDYLKEQKGAYADWQKQSNQYGANAEANAKMIGSGYAESSQVQMYTAYQNRVATARQTYTRAITDYDNKIADARLQNNAKLAEIAYNTLQKTLELSLQGFQYKNTLLQQRLGEKQKVRDRYYTRWNDLRNHLMQEKQFKEQVREFNKSFNRGSGGGSSSGRSSSRSYSRSYSGSGGSSGGVKLTKGDNNPKLKKKPKSDGWVSGGKGLTNVVNNLGYSAGTNLNNLVKAGKLETKTVKGVTYYRKK